MAEFDTLGRRRLALDEGFDRCRRAHLQGEGVDVVERVVVDVHQGHELAGEHHQVRGHLDRSGLVIAGAQPGLGLLARIGTGIVTCVEAAPGAGEEFGHPAVAVLVAGAEGIGVGAVLAGEQGEGQRLVEGRLGQPRAVLAGQEDEGHVAAGRRLGPEGEAGHALVEQARARLVAGVVELAHGPGAAGVVAQGDAGVRVQQAEAAQVEAGARDEGRLRSGALEFLPDQAGEAQHAVLVGGRDLDRAFAEGGDAGEGAAARAQAQGGQGGGECAPEHQIATFCEPSSRYQVSCRARKKALLVSAWANS